jgi:hypothetical protein
MSEKQRHTGTGRPATQAEAQEPGNRFEGEVKPPQPRAEPPQTNDATPDPDQQNREEFDRLLTNNPNLPESASLTSPPNPTPLSWFSATTPDHVSKLYFFTPAQSSDAPPQYVPYSDALTTLTPIAQDSSNPDYPAANTLLQRIHQQRPDLGAPPLQQANQAQTQQSNQTNQGELNPNDHRAAIQARQRRATEQQSTPAIPPEEFAQRSPPPRNTTSGPQPATKIVTPQAAPAPPQPPQPKSSTNT